MKDSTLKGLIRKRIPFREGCFQAAGFQQKPIKSVRYIAILRYSATRERRVMVVGLSNESEVDAFIRAVGSDYNNTKGLQVWVLRVKEAFHVLMKMKPSGKLAMTFKVGQTPVDVVDSEPAMLLVRPLPTKILTLNETSVPESSTMTSEGVVLSNE